MRILIPIFLAAATMCHGSVLNLTLIPDTLIGNPGDTVHFSGSLTNTTNGTVFINSDSILFALGVDDTPFFNNAPIFLGALAGSGIFDIFDITIPLGQGPGTYDGGFTILGGASTDFNNVGEAAFHVTVNESTTASPEPASTILVGLGLAGASLLARRARLTRE
uniref:PEP-CTERM protein-sorting domain-containing protein n=1 Tax=Solibacter usitatus (strain Ellin6076) TaxID=234267 RepID=Q02CP7_SOLUE